MNEPPLLGPGMDSTSPPPKVPRTDVPSERRSSPPEDAVGVAIERTPTPPTTPSAREPLAPYAWAVIGLALALAAVSLWRHWEPNRWLFGDGSFYMNVSRGLIENGSLRQETLHPHSWYEQNLGWNENVDAAWSNIALGRHGEWWPKHPILMPIAATPFIWAFGPLGSLVFQVLCFALMALFAFRVAARVAPRPAALAAAAAFVATPWIFDRVWGFNNDVFYSVLILAALDAALGRRAALSGFLVGLGVFAKATNVLYGPALFALFLLRKPREKAIRFAVAAAIPAIAYLALNTYLYGSPFATGYDRILVREHGTLAIHSHAADFHFRELAQALPRALRDIGANVPLFFVGLAGLAVVFARTWREGLALLWCLTVPILFHAPYAWYRLEFNLPQLALAVAPLGAILLPLSRPSQPEPAWRVPWRWGFVFVLVVAALVGTGLSRRLLARNQSWFWRELPGAVVTLGDIPCDYFNNQNERWECSHFDSDTEMTGRVLNKKLAFERRFDEPILFSPHSSGKPRVLEYRNVPMTHFLGLRFGQPSGARPDAVVDFKLVIDGEQLIDERLTGAGLVERKLDTERFAGRPATVTMTVTSPSARGVRFVVGGGPMP